MILCLNSTGSRECLQPASWDPVVGSPDVMHEQRRRALSAVVALSLTTTALAGWSAAATAQTDPAEAASPAPEDAAGPSAGPIGDPVPAPALEDLVLPDGSTFDLADLAGEPVLIYFGYTHCPDVCPATLGELFGVFEAEPETQALFVTVDPERDTPEFLEEWTKYLPDNLYAVTGTPGAIRRAADNYGVKYARVETTSTAGYTMSHTAELYLIDADGNLLLAYPFGTPAAEIVEDLRALDAA